MESKRTLNDIFQCIKTNFIEDINPRVISTIYNDSILDLLISLKLKLMFSISSFICNEYQSFVSLSSELVFIPLNLNIGYFTISCLSKPDNPFIIYTSLTIHIDEEVKYNNEIFTFANKGLSRFIIGITIQIFMNILQNENKNLIIDTDASSGFWDYIGFIPTPEYILDDRKGYEKYIKLKDMYKWSLKKKCSIYWGSRRFKHLFIQ